jgi:hypothetical protein
MQLAVQRMANWQGNRGTKVSNLTCMPCTMLMHRVYVFTTHKSFSITY